MLINTEMFRGEYGGIGECRLYREDAGYRSIFVDGPVYNETAMTKQDYDEDQESRFSKAYFIEDHYRLEAYRHYDVDGVPATDLLYASDGDTWLRKTIEGVTVAEIWLTARQVKKWRSTPYAVPTDDADTFRVSAMKQCSEASSDVVPFDRCALDRGLAARLTVVRQLSRLQLQLAIMPH